MKICITALNSQYIHTSLAPWYLKAACENGTDEIKVLDLTINCSIGTIRKAIYLEKPDVLAFSCYIFNIDMIETIISDIKKLLPKVIIILGGPEVTFDPFDVLARCKNADYIICGEGELALKQLLETLQKGAIPLPYEIDGLLARGNNDLTLETICLDTKTLGGLPSPYTEEMLCAADGKILYFEASRGCPFHCSYCLSSASGGARFFELEMVKQNLKKVMLSNARQIKFVDRTFNCDLKRAKEIISFILKEAQNDTSGVIKAKNYHFEAAADLFDDELINLLQSAPAGLFQLEIGIQSLNMQTLEAVNRKTDLKRCINNIKQLLAKGNIHIHIDLIAGLPFENYSSFAQSFNGIYKLRPHCIQLGFLKLLKGSGMRTQADNGGYFYENAPPYEVLCSPELTFLELLKLKDIAQVIEKLYNSGRFTLTLEYICKEDAFSFFSSFASFLLPQNSIERAVSMKELYSLFTQFAEKNLLLDKYEVFIELLKFDYFSSDSSCNPPKELKKIYNPNTKKLYKTETSRNTVHLEDFAFDPQRFINTKEKSGRVTWRFDYSCRNAVTGRFKGSSI